jgi:hypothetical protein
VARAGVYTQGAQFAAPLATLLGPRSKLSLFKRLPILLMLKMPSADQLVAVEYGLSAHL